MSNIHSSPVNIKSTKRSLTYSLFLILIPEGWLINLISLIDTLELHQILEEEERHS